MGSILLVALIKYGLLLLLWIFVLLAVRTVRNDLYGSRAAPAAARAGQGRPAAAGAPSSGRARGGRSQARRLVVGEGPLAGPTVTLGASPVTLGRADDSTVVLTDDYASGRHARLVPGEGSWVLEDLGSTNGTFLGTQKVGGPTPVPIGQQIKIGKTVMELRR
jgi:pSer/pThr/pTyr-binding forkhead associated (FHA) protein